MQLSHNNEEIWKDQSISSSVFVFKRRGHTDKFTDLFSLTLAVFWGKAWVTEAAAADNDLYQLQDLPWSF